MKTSRSQFRAFLLSPPTWFKVSSLILLVILYGASGFLYFEIDKNPDLSWLDAFWYSFVTITTVGYGDFAPQSFGGRILIAYPLMTIGIGLLGYILSVSATVLISTATKEQKGMASFNYKNHVVIFNYAGTSKVSSIVSELTRDPKFKGKSQIILVDNDLQELPGDLQKLGIKFVKGNPVKDETLTRANIDDAAYAVVLSKPDLGINSDNLNISITIAIESRAKHVETVIECNSPTAEELIKKASGDRVICTSKFNAGFLTQELLNPGMQDVIDQLITSTGDKQIFFVDIPESFYDKSYEELAALRSDSDTLLLGVQTQGNLMLHPEPALIIQPESKAILIAPSRADAAF